jgi:hypothetical protein
VVRLIYKNLKGKIITKSMFLKVVKYCFPFLILLVFYSLQNLYTEASLKIYREGTNQRYEILKEAMQKDNLPPNIQEHIAHAASISTFNTDLLVGSLNRMQTFFQLMLFIVFYSIYISISASKSKKIE